jgi:hypothetical protein
LFLGVLSAVVLVTGWWLVRTSARGPYALKRSFPGRVLRYFAGKAEAAQEVDDLADELNDPSNSKALRAWASDIVSKNQGRTFSGEGVQDFPVFCALDASLTAPPFIQQNQTIYHGLKPEPSILLDDGKHATGALLCWGNSRMGLIIAPGGIPPVPDDVFYQRQVDSDFRVFCMGF